MAAARKSWLRTLKGAGEALYRAIVLHRNLTGEVALHISCIDIISIEPNMTFNHCFLCTRGGQLARISFTTNCLVLVIKASFTWNEGQ